MKLSSESVSVINHSLDKLVSRFSNPEDEIVTDIHLQPVFETGEIVIFNDEDAELDRFVLPELTGLNSRSAVKEVETILRRSLENYRKKFEHLSILKPFSFVLVDMDKETISDLMLVDDDLVIADGELLKDLDKDLNDFLKHLLAD
ncbi:MAG: hypothetical protein HUJ99_01240 [Bacteroidaceae bacterium]|nr:hypothetical protein [Bacteroidaceae bacterium]